MDHPYMIERQDERGRVERARTRYLGDAMAFVRAVIQLEVNQCFWRIRNEETNRLCARFRYEAGKVTHEV